MDDFDPMKATVEERRRAVMVVGWSLTIVRNHTSDEKLMRAIDRADRALNVVAARLTAEAWPPPLERSASGA